jgi:hypothetical protein
VATYSEIEDYVRERYGYCLKSCWIAHVKADHGLTRRIAHNRASSQRRKHPCPDDKRPAIEHALRHFRMI